MFSISKVDNSSNKLFRDLAKETNRLNTLPTHKKALSITIEKIQTLIANINLQIETNIFINTLTLKALKHILWITELISLPLFVTSIIYHHKLYREPYNIATLKEYFSSVFSGTIYITINKNTSYIPHYGKYKYVTHAVPSVDCLSSYVLFTVHLMMQAIASFDEDTQIPASMIPYKFCSLHNFPEASSNMNIAPDSYISIIYLSITTFLWTTYIILLREKLSLEKWASKEKSKQGNLRVLQELTKSLSIYLTKNINGKNLTFLPKTIETNDITTLITFHENLREIIPPDKWRYLENLINDHKISSPTFSMTTNLLFLSLLLINLQEIFNYQKTKLPVDNYLICIWSMLTTISVYLKKLSF